ncbi:MAG: FtsX-like permease family protein [Bacteroidales bacterium]
MMAIKLALRNLIGAGLRTWLNVIVLSFAFVVIIWHKGLLDGWDKQAKTDMTNWETAGGQYWHKNYDPYDPFTLNDSHGIIPQNLDSLVQKGELCPILVTQGTIYPSGRLFSILIKGIDPDQKLLAVPSVMLKSIKDDIPAIIGTSMANSTKLKQGDIVTLRWRDKNGAFDATEIKIAGIFKTNVPSTDVSQIWIPLEKLRTMLLMPDEATLIVKRNSKSIAPAVEGWVFKSKEILLSDLDKIMKTKSIGGMVLWTILLMLAMLAIFDTQVLAIFRRQKEIGTYVAMGMTRSQVVGLFTVEGAMHSILAALLGAVYGVPLLAYQSYRGISFPVKGSDYGISVADTLYPQYGFGLIVSTILIVLLTTTIVSYWPARKISKMKPTDALRGKIQ